MAKLKRIAAGQDFASRRDGIKPGPRGFHLIEMNVKCSMTRCHNYNSVTIGAEATVEVYTNEDRNTAVSRVSRWLRRQVREEANAALVEVACDIPGDRARIAEAQRVSLETSRK